MNCTITHDAQWLTTAPKAGNECAAENYSPPTKMSAGDLQQALRAHAKSILTTDFESLSPRFAKEDGVLCATFDCHDSVELKFYTEDQGDTWHVYGVVKK